eukprot:SM000018S03624  [mRNA]  locus=s18:317222:321070:- [translate_table: standard]
MSLHCTSSAFGRCASAKVVTYNLTISQGFSAPDCVMKEVILINGVFPGPTLTATEGDTLVVNVLNQLVHQGVTIHWHGIRQYKTPYADGPAYVTQCPIQTDEVYQYKFTLDKSGTYFYHGHYGLQVSNGLTGLLIVKESSSPSKLSSRFPYKIDGEIAPLLLNDWWHRSIDEQAVGLNSIPFGWVGEPQSLLINGRGKYNCSLVPKATVGSGDALTCNASSPSCSLPTMTNQLQPGKTYRWRIVSAASLSTLNLVVEGHRLTVVVADGWLMQPFTVSTLNIYSGQAVEVLLTTSKVAKNYWIGINVRGRKPSTPTGLAVLNLAGVSRSALPTTAPPVSPLWNDTASSKAQLIQYKGRYDVRSNAPKVPKKADRQIIMVGTQNLINGAIRWAVNNRSYTLPSTPILLSLADNVKNGYDMSPPLDKPAYVFDYSQPPPNKNATYGQQVYTLQPGSTVDIVIQNTNTLTPSKAPLAGRLMLLIRAAQAGLSCRSFHRFVMLLFKKLALCGALCCLPPRKLCNLVHGMYKPADNSEYHPWHLHGHSFWVVGYGDGTFNSASDPAKYNLVDPPYRHSSPVLPYGWTTFRFIADNPGAWNFHCHIIWHQVLGMEAVFVIPGKFGDAPKDTKKCGLIE